MSTEVGRSGAGVAPGPDSTSVAAGVAGLSPLDRLATLAATLLNAPSAQLSMLSDVQRVAGGFGLPGDVKSAATPLSDSLCSVTTSCGVALVVDDARTDPRVAALPPVTSGAVGSYLGVPLATAGGAAIGALCVFGPEVRAWSARDVAVLGQVAQWAVVELELAAQASDREADRHRWQLSIDAAGIGSFDWDLRAGRVRSDTRMRELFDIPEHLGDVPTDAFVERIHPDDVGRVTAAIEEAVGSLGVYQVEHRVLRPGNGQRWVRTRGRVLADERGKATRLLGSTLDTTDERDADARAVRVLESMSAAFISLDAQWRMTYINGEAERLLDLRRDDVLGRDIWELFPEAVGTVFDETYRRAVETGRPQTFEAYYPAPLDAWYEVRALPSVDGLAIYFVDVTERRGAQELVQLSYDVSERLAASLDVDESLHGLAQSLVPRLADWTLVSLTQPDGTLRDVSSWHVDPAMRDTVVRYSATRMDDREDESTAAEAVRTADPVVLPAGATEADLAVVRSPSAIDAIRTLAPESALVLPLGTGDRRSGALTLVRGATRLALTAQEIGVASTIAQRASMALENTRLFAEQRETAERLSFANRRLRGVAEHQQTVARALQEAMLTRLPQSDHLELAARYLTASADEKVGGDWYDAMVLPGGATLVSIGDVVGHDIHAAAVMGQLRNMLRMVAWDRDEAPSTIVSRLDHAMHDLDLDTLATLVTLRIEQTAPDARAGFRTLRWTAAGHPAPVLVHADGTTVLLDQQADLLLGVAPKLSRHDNTHPAPPDSTLLLYTDGLVETRHRDVLTGQHELLRAAKAHHRLPVAELIDAVVAEMVSAEPDDDVAILAARFHAE